MHKIFQLVNVLFNFKNWKDSLSLKTGGLLTIFGAVEAYLASTDGQTLVHLLADTFNVSQDVMIGALISIIGLAVTIRKAVKQKRIDDGNRKTP